MGSLQPRGGKCRTLTSPQCPQELPSSQQLGPILETTPDGNSWAQAQDRVRVAGGAGGLLVRQPEQGQASPRGCPPWKVETTAPCSQTTDGPGDRNWPTALVTFATQCGSNTEGRERFALGDGRGREPWYKRSPPSSPPPLDRGEGRRGGPGHIPDPHHTEGRTEMAGVTSLIVTGWRGRTRPGLGTGTGS